MAKPLILVAEDEPDVRDLIVKTFELVGFEVLAAADGFIAVKEANQKMPDIALMDVRMPNMTGLEACQMLKSQEKTKHIPVIFLSAYGQESDINAGLKVGAVDYLVKPFDLTHLIERVNRVLSDYSQVR